MSYIKLEHRVLGDDRWLALSPSAFTLHVWALDHANEQATDGRVPVGRARRLVCPVDPVEVDAAWAELVDAGMWVLTEDGYLCPDFTSYGIAAAEQSVVRQKWADDKRRQRLHKIGNHDLCTSRSCAAVSSGQVDRLPLVRPATSGRSDQTRPDSTRSDPARESDRGRRCPNNGHPWADDASCCGMSHDSPRSVLIDPLHRVPGDSAEVSVR